MAETLLLLSARAQIAEPVLTDLQVAPLSLNGDGRLRVTGKPGLFTNAVGNITTAGSAAANVVAVDVTDASNVIVGLKNTGSAAMAAGVFAFEASLNSTDGVDGDWVAIQMARSDSNTIENSRAASSLAAGAAQAYTWEASVNGYRWFRVRCTTSVTASSIATWTLGRGAYATDPAPAIQAHAITGSVTATPVTGTPYALVTAASTNAAVIKASAGSLFEFTASNPTATAAYVKIYNLAVAPTVGTSVPMFTIPVAAGANVTIEYGQIGKRLATGIAIAVTAAAIATDTGVAVAGVQISATYI